MGRSARRNTSTTVGLIGPAVLSLCGCFDPAFNDGQFTCSPDELCPPGQTCINGVCRSTIVGSDARPDNDPDAATVDANITMPDGNTLDAALSCTDFASAHFDACAIVEPGADMSVDQAGVTTLDTDTGTLTPPSGPSLLLASEVLAGGERLISVASLTVGGTSTLRVVGSRPLIVASWSTIDVIGTIDASSQRAGSPGAGATIAPCSPGAGGDGENLSSGAAGAGGGGFGTEGGDGGPGDENQVGPSTPGVGGTALQTPPLLVRAGCPGGSGGDGEGPTGGAGGLGGGAVQLTAAESITVNGLIHAGGAGGTHGTMIDGGGGGGGSGGLVGMEAPAVNLAAARLFAKGAGGGEGSDDSGTGNDGDDGPGGFGTAQGGNGGTSGGGDGGDGGVGAVGGEDVVEFPVGGGGGGGGGVGFVLVRGAINGSPAISSPPVTTLANGGG